MSIRQFQEWRAYADLEPFGEERDDLRAASIVQVLRNLFGRRKGQRPIPLEDCVLRFGQAVLAEPGTPEQRRRQVLRTMELLMAIYNQPVPKKARR